MGRTSLQQPFICELGIMLSKCEIQGALLFFLYIVCTYFVLKTIWSVNWMCNLHINTIVSNTTKLHINDISSISRIKNQLQLAIKKKLYIYINVNSMLSQTLLSKLTCYWPKIKWLQPCYCTKVFINISTMRTQHCSWWILIE